MKPGEVVFVLNTNDDIVELLRIVFEQAGFVVISAHVDAIKRGTVDIEQLVEQHQPSVILYDIPPPYERQWAFLSHMRKLPSLEKVRFVLTSTNAARIREMVPTDETIYEIIGKPYDLDLLVEAVKRA
jgi:CheY-like chemotaxis protein